MIRDNDKEYLGGRKFSNGFVFNVDKASSKTLNRLDYLAHLVASKKVLHIGFSDHLPLIEKKYTENTWLHKKLIDSSSACIGVDINAEAVSFCRNKLSIEGVFCHDIINDNELLPEICEQTWDYAILGEILEHVDNPVLFLRVLKERYGQHIKKLVVTVPNAWDVENFKYIRNNKEFINSDHRYWFTPFTLAKVLTMAGYSVELVDHVDSFNNQNFFHRFLKRRYPMLSENLLAISSLE